MSSPLVIGAPAWKAELTLPLWFESVKANVNPADTGLVFSVPAEDAKTRAVIDAYAPEFKWVSVERDRSEPVPREDRSLTNHKERARARNQVLATAQAARADWFCSWDTDILLPPGSIERMQRQQFAFSSPWVWLNRHAPRALRFTDGELFQECQYENPMYATAMRWDPKNRFRAIHYPADAWNQLTEGIFRVDVGIGVQLMRPEAYRFASYGPHPDSEEVVFCSQLAARQIPRYCHGDVIGLHLHNREARDELTMPWPEVMQLAEQRPLASDWDGQRTELQKIAGLFPVQTTRVAA